MSFTDTTFVTKMVRMHFQGSWHYFLISQVMNTDNECFFCKNLWLQHVNNIKQKFRWPLNFHILCRRLEKLILDFQNPLGNSKNLLSIFTSPSSISLLGPCCCLKMVQQCEVRTWLPRATLILTKSPQHQEASFDYESTPWVWYPKETSEVSLTKLMREYQGSQQKPRFIRNRSGCDAGEPPLIYSSHVRAGLWTVAPAVRRGNK